MFNPPLIAAAGIRTRVSSDDVSAIDACLGPLKYSTNQLKLPCQQKHNFPNATGRYISKLSQLTHYTSLYKI